MFDSTNGVDHAITAGNSQSQDKHDKKPLKTDRSNIPTGVIGVGMNRQGSNDEPNLYVAEELEEVSNTSLATRASETLSDTIHKI